MDLTTVTHIAVECGFNIKKKLRNFTFKNIPIEVRIGVGSGDLSLYCVGGILDRCELVMAGEAMNQANTAGNTARASQLVITRQVKEKLMSYWSIEHNGNAHKYHFKPFIYFNPHASLLSKRINSNDETILRSYIPRAVLVRMDQGLDPRIADIRDISVIFLKVIDFHGANEISLEEVQETMLLMQKCLYQFEGSINRFGFDDKGAILLAAFGLPPLSHDDDPLRAVNAAIELRLEFAKLGKKCVIGVGTGQVFCGSVGSETRSEYTMHGSIVNYTAGLMQASSSILCDETTRNKTLDKIDYDSVAPVKVKGRSEPIMAYSPVI